MGREFGRLLGFAAGLLALLGIGAGAMGFDRGVGAQGALGAFLPVVLGPEEATLVPTVTPTQVIIIPTQTPTPTPTVQPPPAGCSICSYDAYNCSDFGTQAAAQACHDYCFGLVGYDVHQLDADGDGEACESLPRVEFGGWVFLYLN